jgi:hypothetical protein
MVDDDLSAAVVLYTAHKTEQSPQADEDAVLSRFGPKRGPDLLARVESLFSEAGARFPSAAGGSAP